MPKPNALKGNIKSINNKTCFSIPNKTDIKAIITSLVKKVYKHSKANFNFKLSKPFNFFSKKPITLFFKKITKTHFTYKNLL
jgi:hypothetical protein